MDLTHAKSERPGNDRSKLITVLPISHIPPSSQSLEKFKQQFEIRRLARLVPRPHSNKLLRNASILP